MIYVMSDIHGCYDKYKQMLAEIDFREEDILYVLGDVIDRGPDCVKVLKDMMMRTNVFPIMGNHEIVMINLFPRLLTPITEENYDKFLTEDDLEKLAAWFEDGGEPTIEAFRNLSMDERDYVYEYLLEFSVCEIVDVEDKTFILTHSGLPKNVKFEDLEDNEEYEAFDFIMGEIDFNKKYFDDDIYVVRGHKPTFDIDPAYRGRIYRKNNIIAIDTGAVFGEKLACLCLDTDEEFYV